MYLPDIVLNEGKITNILNTGCTASSLLGRTTGCRIAKKIVGGDGPQNAFMGSRHKAGNTCIPADKPHHRDQDRNLGK